MPTNEAAVIMSTRDRVHQCSSQIRHQLLLLMNQGIAQPAIDRLNLPGLQVLESPGCRRVSIGFK